MLLLCDCPPVLHLTERDAETCPDAVQKCKAVSDAKYKRACIEEICVPRAGPDPKMVEEREEQKGVQVQKRRHDRVTKIWHTDKSSASDKQTDFTGIRTRVCFWEKGDKA